MPQKIDFIRFSSSQPIPQEESLKIENKKQKMKIGVLKELSENENRIPLVPQSVGLLVAQGNEVVIESDAGENAGYLNADYQNVGAKIAYQRADVFEADVICKVSPFSDDEISQLGRRKTIISSINHRQQSKESLRQLQINKNTCLSYEYIKDKEGIYPVVRALSEITGVSIIYIAAELLANNNFGKARLFGGFPGIPPTNVVVLGAGTVAEYTIKAAIALGASVKVFDNSLYKLRRLKNLVGEIYTSTIQPEELQNALLNADIVIGAIHSKTGLTPLVVTEEMVCKMKDGTVIIDVSIDQGGVFETSKVTNHHDPIFSKCGVTHYCVPNIASNYPNTGSIVLSNILTEILLQIGDSGGVEEVIRFDAGLRNGVYMYQGILTKAQIGQYFSLPFQDLNLLLASF